MAGEQRVIHTQAAAGAVFDDELRVPRKHRVEPLQIGALVAQQAVAKAVGVHLRADAGLYIVIHFNIAHAVFPHQPVNHPVGVSNHSGMPEIQLVPAAVVNLFAVAQEVPLPGNLVGQGTFDAHHLDFQPDAGHHALFRM